MSKRKMPSCKICGVGKLCRREIFTPKTDTIYLSSSRFCLVCGAIHEPTGEIRIIGKSISYFINNQITYEKTKSAKNKFAEISKTL